MGITTLLALNKLSPFLVTVFSLKINLKWLKKLSHCVSPAIRLLM